jgi:hypothetical protein
MLFLINSYTKFMQQKFVTAKFTNTTFECLYSILK